MDKPIEMNEISERIKDAEDYRETESYRGESEEDIAFRGALRKYKDVFGRKVDLAKIEAENPPQLTKGDFVREMVAHRPRFLSKEFAIRNAEVFFRETGERVNSKRHQYIKKYNSFVWEEVKANIANRYTFNPYIEEFKRNYMMFLEKSLKEWGYVDLTFDKQDLIIEMDKDEKIKLRRIDNKNSVVIFKKKNWIY